MRYAIEFWTGSEWIRWKGTHASRFGAWLAIHERRLTAPHLKRRVVEVAETNAEKASA